MQLCRASNGLVWGLTGKIAASSGHAAWISSKMSRNRVFELRGRSDAIIVGGNTVRKDSKYLLYLVLCENGADVF